MFPILPFGIRPGTKLQQYEHKTPLQIPPIPTTFAVGKPVVRKPNHVIVGQVVVGKLIQVTVEF